jgi:hypothetical protein
MKALHDQAVKAFLASKSVVSHKPVRIGRYGYLVYVREGMYNLAELGLRRQISS